MAPCRRDVVRFEMAPWWEVGEVVVVVVVRRAGRGNEGAGGDGAGKSWSWKERCRRRRCVVVDERKLSDVTQM
jgi:hypothetical protein